ncbi:3-hydroxybenzoate transporter MhbT [Paraburkholderia phenoliruptrix]|uniref:3-hydroxybenzoate transporter MhbT n=1 Tax=Paraburkholderia phenoliruptrix TaxID=252970 RepID=A0A6J5B180_9BURK|nr:MFS transporter [Paraburkholderia phenoliruptrix]CAB3686261.1 3-hydroxybenzoate transporter MhbT [Paraburkholderia phenoliruptrix]
MSTRAHKPDVIDVAATIDAQPVGAFQKRLMVLIALCVVIDGFDVQSMGFVAPALISSWHVSRAAMGPVFGASLVGMLIGALTMGPLADRVGRRPVLLGCTAFVGAMMIATAFAASLAHLLALRFVTGCGLGGIMGNAVALVSEYSPARKRATLTMWVSCGFTLGAAFGGVVSALLIPLAGWRAVFALGGVVPLLIAAAMAAALPESMQFLIARGAQAERIGALLQRVAPAARVALHTRFVAPMRTHEGSSVAALFAEGRARVTLFAWGVNFMNLLNLFFLANWLPTIATDFGYGVADAAIIGTTLQVGGMIGTLAMGPLIDRWGFFRVLVPVYLIATVAILSISHVPAVSLAMLLAIVTASGFAIVGGQPANNALSAALYPVTLRATGVGWSLGIGRAGSIVGPIVAGALMQLHWSAQQLFCAAAIPALLSALMLYAMSRERCLTPTRKPSTEAA